MPVRPREELPGLLAEQVDFLSVSAARYDEGYEHEAKRMALSLRVLLHDSRKSVSLLRQLEVKDTLRFLDSDAPREAPAGRQVAWPSQEQWPIGFVGIRLQVGGPNSFFPTLDEDLGQPRGSLHFPIWWEKRVLYRPGSSDYWQRRHFILGAADKEGGAHVDPRPSAWWAELWRGTATGPDGEPVPIKTVAPPVIRQITYEVLTTLGEAGLGARPERRTYGPSGLVSTVELDTPAPSPPVTEQD